MFVCVYLFAESQLLVSEAIRGMMRIYTRQHALVKSVGYAILERYAVQVNVYKFFQMRSVN